MQQQDSFYPVRIISRSATKKRSRRRASIIFSGLALGSALWLSSSVTLTCLHSLTYAVSLGSVGTIPAPAILAAIDVAAPFIPTASPATAEKNADVYPLALDLKVEEGDTLMSILTDSGVSYEEAHNAVVALGALYDPKRLDIGNNISVVLDKTPASADALIIVSLRLPLSASSAVEATRAGIAQNSTFSVKKIDAVIERKLARAGGRINSSLYETGVAAGIPMGVLSEIISAYSYDVDFQREIQPGDKLDVLFERLQTREGTAAGHGNMLFAELDLGGHLLRIYRYVDKAGNADYYNEKGESVRKELLRTPINGAKITSGYGMRNHPILGYSRMHRGVDFGAPIGTPIYAAGDGMVEFVGSKGGYGNYLRIKHNNKYDSAYAHISRFATGIAPGRHVKQGQIVAYVGATGMATGPHLHYEILVNNEQVNPASIKFKTGNVLQGRELSAFRKNVEQIQAQFSTTPNRQTDLAMLDTQR